MGAQGDLHPIIDIEPLRVMIELLGKQRTAAHKTDLIEVLEQEDFANGRTSRAVWSTIKLELDQWHHRKVSQTSVLQF